MTTPLGHQRVQTTRAIKLVSESDAWDIELLLVVKDFPGIVGGPTLQRGFVSRLQRGRQRTSCRHLWENQRDLERVYIRRDVEIRKYGVTLGFPGCMAITAVTTAQGHSPECRVRIEQRMLEDTTGEGAIRIEEANRRKRARPDDEGGRPDVEMVEAATTPVQYGGSSSSQEERPGFPRRKNVEGEQLGGDVVRAKLRDPQGGCASSRGGTATVA